MKKTTKKPNYGPSIDSVTKRVEKLVQEAEKEMPRIVVYVEDGLVEEVYSTVPVLVLIKDRDRGVENPADEIRYSLFGGDGHHLEVEPKTVAKMFRQSEK